MAFDPAPSAWLQAGYSVETSPDIIKIEHSDGPGTTIDRLSVADADPETGDVRTVFMALCFMMWTAWQAQAAADRPQNMLVNHSQTITEPTGGGSLQVRHNFNLQFVTEADALENEEVADEP